MAPAADRVSEIPADAEWFRVSGAAQIHHVFPASADTVLCGRVVVPRTQDGDLDMIRCTGFAGFDRKPAEKWCLWCRRLYREWCSMA